MTSISELAPVLKRRHKIVLCTALGILLVAYIPHFLYLAYRVKLLVPPELASVKIAMKEGWLPVAYPGWLSSPVSLSPESNGIGFAKIIWYQPWLHDLILFRETTMPPDLTNSVVFKRSDHPWGIAFATESRTDGRPLTSDWAYIPQFGLSVVLPDARLLSEVTTLTRNKPR